MTYVNKKVLFIFPILLAALYSCSPREEVIQKDMPIKEVFYGEDDVIRACNKVIHTYNTFEVAKSISKNLPISIEDAQPLGKKAVESWGKCLCVVSSHFNILIDVSTGYCIGEDYLKCDTTAFCGRQRKAS